MCKKGRVAHRRVFTLTGGKGSTLLSYVCCLMAALMPYAACLQGKKAPGASAKTPTAPRGLTEALENEEVDGYKALQVSPSTPQDPEEDRGTKPYILVRVLEDGKHVPVTSTGLKKASSHHTSRMPFTGSRYPISFPSFSSILHAADHHETPSPNSTATS